MTCDVFAQTSNSPLLDRARQFGAALAARDAAGVAALYADDAVAVGADGKVVTGRPAVEGLFRELLKDQSFTLTATPVRSEVNGDIGYVFGDFTVSASSVRTKGHYVEVWKKTRGDWMIAYDVATATPAAPNTSK